MKLNLEKTHWALKLIPVILMAPALFYMRVVAHLSAALLIGYVTDDGEPPVGESKR